MSAFDYKCRLCGKNDVAVSGELCDSCRMKLGLPVEFSSDDTFQHEACSNQILENQNDEWYPTDPFAEFEYMKQREESEMENNYPEEIDSEKQDVENLNECTSVVTKQNGESKHITKGYIKNIRYNKEESKMVSRWARSIVYGVPFSFDDYTTVFQVFPDFTGTSRAENGAICDQVVMYGRILRGTLSDNNEVEVRGARDRHNQIVASKVINVASGTMCKASGAIPGSIVRLSAILIILFIAAEWDNIAKFVIGAGIIIVLIRLFKRKIKRFFRRPF